MHVKTFLGLYLCSLPIFLLIDLVWLVGIAPDFYQTEIGHLLGEVRLEAAVAFYILFLVGLTFFAIYPAWQKRSVKTGLLLGGLFGFFTYATYDLTNLATLKDWSVIVTFADMVWGTFLGGLVSGMTVLLYTRWRK